MAPYDPTPIPWIEDVIVVPRCIGSGGVRKQLYEDERADVKVSDRAAIRELVRSRIDAAQVGVLVETARAIQGVNAFADDEAARMRDWLWEHRSDSDWVRVLRADDRAQLGRWDEVVEALAPCTAAAFGKDEDHAQHHHHLLALAALHRGDVQTLREQLGEAEKHAGSCDLRALSALILPEGAGDDEMPKGMVPLAELVWTLRRADACLDAGAPEDALIALGRQRLFGEDNVVQVLARRWRRSSTRTPGRRGPVARCSRSSRRPGTGRAWTSC
jgi:hypothetical protein